MKVLIQEAAFFFQSQSQLFFFPQSCTFGRGRNCFCRWLRDALANFHVRLALAPFLCTPAKSHQKKYSHSKRTFNIYFVNVPSQHADSTRDNVIPETSSSARRKFLSYSFMALHARSFSLTLILTGRVPHAEQPACRVTGHINNC